MKRIVVAVLICTSFSLLLNGRVAQAGWQTPIMSDYSKVPPFISREIPPNVIIAMDISGSMKAVAYRDTSAGNWKTGMHDDFNPAINYYGYFKSTAKYTYDDVKELLNYTDLVLLDIKHLYNDDHKKITWVWNKTILEFAKYLEKINKSFWIRHVLVPGFTDNEKHLEDLWRHFKDFKNLERLEILPYHTL